MTRVARFLNRPSPLNQATFLADMDLLAIANQTDDDAPLRNALTELDEVLWL